MPVAIRATSLPQVGVSVDSLRADPIPPILWNRPRRERGHSLWLLVLVQINPRAVKFIEIAAKSKTTAQSPALGGDLLNDFSLIVQKQQAGAAVFLYLHNNLLFALGIHEGYRS